jgi:hypothetical protein
MAKIAKEIVQQNGFSDIITVVPKSSMDTSIPEGFMNMIIVLSPHITSQ